MDNPGERAVPLDLAALVERAIQGDRAALEVVIEEIRDQVYHLSLRMLWHPADAEDATQDILIRVVTHLGTFRGESAFTTWVYRVAANYLLTTRKRRAERENLTFERFAEQLDEGLGPVTASVAAEVETRLLLEEVKIGCTQGMLLCLNRGHRLAYILGHVFDVSSSEGAAICGVTPATFRKRLSRARRTLHAFIEQRCGLVNAASPCRCARRVSHAVRIGRVDPDRLLFAGDSSLGESGTAISEAVGEMEQFYRAADLLRGHPRSTAPEAAGEALQRLLNTERLIVLGS